MRADVAQQRDVAERIQPIGIVGHQGIRRAIAEAQERLEAEADARHVGGNLLVGQKLA